MASPDTPSAPGFKEALATLKQLADVFLLSGRRAAAVVTEEDAPRRSGAMILDERGHVRALDAGAEQLFRRRQTDLVGTSAASLIGTIPAQGARWAIVDRFEEAGAPIWATRNDLVLDGRRCSVVSLHEGEPAAARSEIRYRHLVDQIPAVVFSAALDGGLHELYVSPQIEGLLGYSQEEWLASPVLWYERLHRDDRRTLDREFARGCATGGPFRADCRFLRRDGRIVWVHGEARLIRDGAGAPILLQGVAFDISETKRAEEIASASLREKETLLKEIHHRVKNNLQVTSSLLRLQAERVEDESARRALREGQSRIRSMALVHELLYRSKDLSRVDLAEYVRDLVRQLVRSHGAEAAHVRVETRLTSVAMPIDIAVPCGLILNELVSNALKHAFPAGHKGLIEVAIEARDRSYVLTVRDDGVGLPSDLDPAATTTLGLRLVRTLADQLGAELLVRSKGGTEVSLRLPRPGGALP